MYRLWRGQNSTHNQKIYLIIDVYIYIFIYLLGKIYLDIDIRHTYVKCIGLDIATIVEIPFKYFEGHLDVVALAKVKL